MEKRTANYWEGNGYGMRILDIKHGIDDYAVLAFIMNGEQREETFDVKIEHDEEGTPGIYVNQEFYGIHEFIVDGYPNI